MSACAGGRSGGGLQNHTSLRGADGRQGACGLPLNQLPSLLQSRICLLVPARGMVMCMERVVVPTCGLAVRLTHTWKALGPSQLLHLPLILWRNHV